MVSQLQYIKLPNSLNSMKTRESIREKYEENKRNCLLKKIRFYEYLIGQNGPEKRFLPGVETKNKKATLFFHTFTPLYPDQQTLQPSLINNQTFTNKSSNQQSLLAIWGSKEVKLTKTAKRQAFRITKREKIENINELITKSMTPQVRVHKKTIDFTNPENKSKSARMREEWSVQENNRVKCRHTNPQKRTYVGGAHYLKQAKKKVTATVSYRKQSICPWDINQLEY